MKHHRTEVWCCVCRKKKFDQATDTPMGEKEVRDRLRELKWKFLPFTVQGADGEEQRECYICYPCALEMEAYTMLDDPEKAASGQPVEGSWLCGPSEKDRAFQESMKRHEDHLRETLNSHGLVTPRLRCSPRPVLPNSALPPVAWCSGCHRGIATDERGAGTWVDLYEKLDREGWIRNKLQGSLVEIFRCPYCYLVDTAAAHQKKQEEEEEAPPARADAANDGYLYLHGGILGCDTCEKGIKASEATAMKVECPTCTKKREEEERATSPAMDTETIEDRGLAPKTIRSEVAWCDICERGYAPSDPHCSPQEIIAQLLRDGWWVGPKTRKQVCPGCLEGCANPNALVGEPIPEEIYRLAMEGPRHSFDDLAQRILGE